MKTAARRGINLMSVQAATMPLVRAELETLVTLATDPTTLGQLEYIDAISTASVTWCRRPGDWERVGAVIHELVTEVAALRGKVNA